VHEIATAAGKRISQGWFRSNSEAKKRDRTSPSPTSDGSSRGSQRLVLQSTRGGRAVTWLPRCFSISPSTAVTCNPAFRIHRGEISERRIQDPVRCHTKLLTFQGATRGEKFHLCLARLDCRGGRRQMAWAIKTGSDGRRVVRRCIAALMAHSPALQKWGVTRQEWVCVAWYSHGAGKVCLGVLNREFPDLGLPTSRIH